MKGLANFETFRTKRELGTEIIIGVFFPFLKKLILSMLGLYRFMGYSLAVVLQLLIVVAYLLAEHGF